MNKKEITEVKKQLKPSAGYCSHEQLVTAYIDADKNVKFVDSRMFNAKCEEEQILYFEMFKKMLSGGLGKKLIDLQFPVVNGGNCEEQKFLMQMKKSKLKDEKLNREFIDKLVDKFVYTGSYFVAILYCSYNVPVKNAKRGEENDSTEVYDFIMTSICPVSVVYHGLCYNSVTNQVERSAETVTEITKPMHGFLFPAFNDRQEDVNGVLYYTASEKEPSNSIVNEVLGCSFVTPANVQKDMFNNLLSRVLGDDSTYNVISGVHSAITAMIDSNSAESDPVKVSKDEIKKILERNGVDELCLEDFDDIYEEEVGDGVSLDAVNITNESVMKVDSPDIKINVKPKAADKVSAKLVDGRRCLVIHLDDRVEVNGLDVSVK